MSHIITLEASNVKRLKAVRVDPKNPTVIVGGRNAQGKSSLLDCISMALGGKEACPSAPIRRGQTKAQIVLTTEDLVVTRRFSQTGGASLEVTNKEGLKFPSPQSVLDKLTNTLAFDPLAFTRAEPKEQLRQLRLLVGIDTTSIDAMKKAAFDERTLKNREVRNQKGVVESLPVAGPERVDIKMLLEQLDKANKHNARKDVLGRALDDATSNLKRKRDLAVKTKELIEELEKRLEALRDRLKDETDAIKQAESEQEIAYGDVEKFKPIPTEVLREQLSQAEATNQAAARVEQRRAEATKLAQLEEESAELTKRITLLDQQREATLAKANFPVPGLGLGDDGVTLNDLPLDQASSAEQLRVGLAVACALNPSLKVMLIRDGSLLDDESLQLIADFAEAQNAQVWIERVGDDGKCTVVIEDGEIVAAPAELAAT
jgi:DNA repair exonuclease SbcCD ATPase subunit